MSKTTETITPKMLAEIEAACEALKGVKNACDITHAKPEFVDYVARYCHPAAVLEMAATIRELWVGREALQEHIKGQDRRIVEQRDEIKNRIGAEESAQGTLTAYRKALGGYDGLSRIGKLKSFRTAVLAATADARELVDEVAVVLQRDESNERMLVTAVRQTLIEAITTYATNHGEERWRAGVEAAAKVAEDRARSDGVYGDFASDSAAQSAATVIATDIRTLLPQCEALTCTWTYDPDGYWRTGCGDSFCISNEEGPEANGMRYCHSCGLRLVVGVQVGGEGGEGGRENNP